ncbi:hypothetical protein IKD48_02065 [bacterium]|nr:hypothetical protein [bacterium]
MKLNHLHITKQDLMHKPQRKHALALHKAYELRTMNVPSVKDIVIEQISIAKHINESLSGLDEFKVNEDMMQEHMELCGLLGLDYDSIKPKW